MTVFPETRASLLARLQNRPDEDGAWCEFVALYLPVVYRLARRRGLQDADAEDLAQRVMISVRRGIGSWKVDPARGRFRAWLARIAHNAIINVVTRRPFDAGVGGTAIHQVLEELPEADGETEEELEREYRRSLFRWAAQRIRSEFHDGTWEAFWLTTVDGVSIEEAGAALGKSVGSVYAARSRVMRRLREEIDRRRPGWED